MRDLLAVETAAPIIDALTGDTIPQAAASLPPAFSRDALTDKQPVKQQQTTPAQDASANPDCDGSHTLLQVATPAWPDKPAGPAGKSCACVWVRCQRYAVLTGDVRAGGADRHLSRVLRRSPRQP